MKFDSFLLGDCEVLFLVSFVYFSLQQALGGLEQQLSCLANSVKDLRREEKAILEQSNKILEDIQCIIINGDMVTFLLMLDLMSIILMIVAIDLELETVIMIHLAKEFQGMKLKMKGIIQGQARKKFMESSMGEKSTKVDELSQAQDVLDRKVIQHEKMNTCTFVKEE
ncbi:hypothetical protein M9H77_11738 [Catharanthus roseus]|uniref:Uncharacterized protein n=1 Tax=Catharanthus roseus TaxID=4058 RepID=A0ACC0BFD2_CATRO|nr:hypothetical protein M9H77_11738 [Catharanthus roseus]